MQDIQRRNEKWQIVKTDQNTPIFDQLTCKNDVNLRICEIILFLTKL